MSGSSSLFLLLFEPAFLLDRLLTSSSLTLDFDSLVLVLLQFIGDVGLLRRRRRLRSGKLLHMRFGVTGLDRRGLVGAEFPQVEILHRIG